MSADDSFRTEAFPPGDRLLRRELTGSVLGVYFDVYNELGGGFLEAVYAGAFEIACADAGLMVQREACIPVWFRGRRAADYRADFLVETVLLVEIKAVRALDEVHVAQVINYLRATEIETALLLNFGPRPSFRRLVLENRRKPVRVPPRASAVSEAVRRPGEV